MLLPQPAGRELEEHTSLQLLPDPPVLAVPRPVLAAASYWGPWAYRPFDAYRLAGQARQLLAAVAPRVSGVEGFCRCGVHGTLSVKVRPDGQCGSWQRWRPACAACTALQGGHVLCMAWDHWNKNGLFKECLGPSLELLQVPASLSAVLDTCTRRISWHGAAVGLAV